MTVEESVDDLEQADEVVSGPTLEWRRRINSGIQYLEARRPEGEWYLVLAIDRVGRLYLGKIVVVT